MATENWFNPDFDQELGDALIASIQEEIGCFECGNPDPTKTCSRCKLAKYCSQDCQKADWKKNHRQTCKIYLENKAPQGPNIPGAPVPILLKSIGLLSEPNFVTAMRERQRLFLEAASKSTKKPLSMSFACSVGPIFDKLRMVIEVDLLDDEGRPCRVSNLVVEVVDDNEDAIQSWHQTNAVISMETLNKVVDIWVEFYNQLEKSDIYPTSVTCGSGLQDRLDEMDDKLKAKGISRLALVESCD